MLPQALIEEYWDRVRGILEVDHHLHRARAEQAISWYRGHVVPKAGDMTYHQDARDLAASLACAAKHGGLFPT